MQSAAEVIEHQGVVAHVEASAQLEIVTQRAQTWPEQARSIKIKDQPAFAQAQEMLLGIRDLRKEVDSTFDPICAAAFKAHREATAAKKKAETPLADAEQILRRGISDYIIVQERIRQEAERKAREEAARIQREAEEAHAAECRRLDEEAQRAATEQALADALQAEAEGAHPEEVAAILEQPAPVVAYVAPPPPVYVAPVAAPPVQRAAGISAPRENWSCECFDIKLLCAAIGRGEQSTELVVGLDVKLDEFKRKTEFFASPSLNKLAVALKTTMSVPGCRAKNNPTIAVGRR